MGFNRIVLVRRCFPDTISREEGATDRHLAKNLRQALLAAPSTGGAVNLILILSACKPTIMFFDDRG